MSLVDDAGLAAALVGSAGSRLVEMRDGGLSGRALGEAGDRMADDHILGRLAVERPGDAILSEERADDLARLKARRVWIVDPLDGTREYTEVERDDWAVHVALVEDGRLVVGAVSVPSRGLVVRSDAPPPLTLAPARRSRITVSRTRPPAFAEALAIALDAELVPMGSAGVKAVAVLTGEVDAYVHAGGQWEWDSAAPVAVCLAAGLHASRLDGSPLVYNQARPWVEDLCVCRPELVAALSAALAATG